MRRSVRKLILLLALGSVTFVHARDIPQAAIDTLVEQEMARQQVPGLALAVVSGGQAVLVKGYGMANLEHQVPVRPDTVFQSGSVGKQFTAFAVLLLVDEGRMVLDAPVATYLGTVPASWSGITVRHLLTHTSGLGDYPEGFDFRRDYTEDELLAMAQAQPTAFAPGEKWEYSNLGYLTLGVVIRRVSGQFYGDFLAERAFKPLAMDTTRVISEADIVPNRAAGYELVEGELKNQAWVAPALNTTADGALYFSLQDMLHWDAALRERKLLSSAAYEAMWTPVRLNDGSAYPYGLGWNVELLAGGKSGQKNVSHGGAWQGFKTQISRWLDADLTVIVLANSDSADPGLIAQGVAGLFNAD